MHPPTADTPARAALAGHPALLPIYHPAMAGRVGVEGRIGALLSGLPGREDGGSSSGGEPMSSETPYFGPAYDYEIDPEFRPSYLNLERDVPSLPVEPGIVVRPVLGM